MSKENVNLDDLVLRGLSAELRTLRARVRELEDLFQRTHGCHVGWVAKADAAEARITDLESELTEWKRLMKVTADQADELAAQRASLESQLAAAREAPMKAEDAKRLFETARREFEQKHPTVATIIPSELDGELLTVFARACEQHVLERVALATVAFNHPREALERLVSEIAKENEG